MVFGFGCDLKYFPVNRHLGRTKYTHHWRCNLSANSISWNQCNLLSVGLCTIVNLLIPTNRTPCCNILLRCMLGASWGSWRVSPSYVMYWQACAMLWETCRPTIAHAMNSRKSSRSSAFKVRTGMNPPFVLCLVWGALILKSHDTQFSTSLPYA